MNAKNHHSHKDCSDQIKLINLFRKLWEQHVMWTRSSIISAAANLGDASFVNERLLQNPGDFADVLQRYYGAKTANIFESLLTEHLEIAGQLVGAAKNGDNAAVEKYRQQWYRNADKIAAFLANINPYWNEEEWRSLLYHHLGMTESEAVYRLNGRYAADIAIYEEIEKEALEMADIMANGILKQFGY